MKKGVNEIIENVKLEYRAEYIDSNYQLKNALMWSRIKGFVDCLYKTNQIEAWEIPHVYDEMIGYIMK